MPLPEGITPELLEQAHSVISTLGKVQEKHIMEACAVSRSMARAVIFILVERGALDAVPQGGQIWYRAPEPINLTLVREDLMPGIVQAVAQEAQTVRTLAGRFGIQVDAMQATVRQMHQVGLLAVTMVGATRVCRSV